MAKNQSFDIVSQVEDQEITNAVYQAEKEIENRYDFKGTKCKITYSDDTLTLLADDEQKLKSLRDVLESKLIKRKLPLKAFSYGKEESAEGGSVRCKVTIQQGIPTEKAHEIVKFCKALKLKKVQVAIQGDQLRASGPSRDDLQDLINAIKGHDFDIDIQFSNYR